MGGKISGITYLGNNTSQVIMSGAGLSGAVISAYGTVIWVGSQIVSVGALADSTVVRNLGSQFYQVPVWIILLLWGGAQSDY